MDKKLIFAVAGSGKTTELVKNTRDDRRILIVTYTNENVRNLENALAHEYDGRIPSRITVLSYFSFLYSFCFRPFHSYDLRDNCYTWTPPQYGKTPPSTDDIGHYLTKNRYIYGNRAAKLLIKKGTTQKITSRLENFFDALFVDEVQDFSANDFNFLLEVSKAKIQHLYVGDFFQHTYDSSRDGQTHKNLHNKGADYYLNEFKKIGFELDTETLDKSHRCSPSVCSFVSDQIGIGIGSHRSDETKVTIVSCPEEAQLLFCDDQKVKLFFKNEAKYGCYSNNWGKSKGSNSYKDVCVVLNKNTNDKFEARDIKSLPESTKNKLYVACTRASGDLYILDEQHLKKFKVSK